MPEQTPFEKNDIQIKITLMFSKDAPSERNVLFGISDENGAYIHTGEQGTDFTKATAEKLEQARYTMNVVLKDIDKVKNNIRFFKKFKVVL